MQAHHNSLLAQVLQPRSTTDYRNVRPLKPQTEHQAELLKAAGQRVRAIYREGIQRVFYDREHSDWYWDKRVETWMAYAELDQLIGDETELSIAKGIFDEAGLTSTSIQPTKPETRALMQQEAIASAKSFKNLFATQAALAF